MAKKQAVSKTQAVRDYLDTHPGAMNKEIAAALTKQGIKINAAHVASIKTKIKASTAKKAAKKPASAEAAASATPAVVEKPTKPADTITLDQVKKVAETIRTIGGLQRVAEVLEVIKASGGVKKFKELAEAMTVTATDAVPF
jgi:arginine repressor